MAESQHSFTYNAAIETSFKESLTEARLGKYLLQAGFDFPNAMRLYLWNARLSKAFQFPLHILEVTLRNAVVAHLTYHGAPADWAFDTPYLNSLAGANPAIRTSLNKCKQRLLYDKIGSQRQAALLAGNLLDVPSGGAIDTNDVVASLSFEFWTMLMGGEFESEWQLSLRKVFPNAGPGASRRSLWLTAHKIKNFRNRVAHHEPIFHLADLGTMHADIVDLIGMRCHNTKNWVQHFSTAMSTLKQGGADTAISDQALPLCMPLSVMKNDQAPIAQVLPLLQTPGGAMILLQIPGASRLFTPEDVLTWLIGSTDIGLADLSVSLCDVLALAPSPHRIKYVGTKTTKAEAGAAFYARNIPTKKKPTALIFTDDGTETGAAVGALLKSDMPPRHAD